MRVILSTDSIRYPLTGIGRYTLELARNLTATGMVDNLLFLNGAHISDTLATVDSCDMPRRDTWAGVRRAAGRIGAVARLRSKWIDKRQAIRLCGYGDHIFHGTNFRVPPFQGRSVVTIHDLSPLTLPDFHPQERVRLTQKAIDQAVSRSPFLITDSEFTRKEVASYFSLSDDMVHAIPLACGNEFRPRQESELVAPLGRYGLTAGRYSLFVGTIEPRKNIPSLLDAYGRLPKWQRDYFPLVLIGQSGWKSESIHGRIKEAEKEGWARYLGYVREDDLPPIYSGARVFAFPSYYEGFGLPVLEAMASGVPVVCSNSSSLPEVTNGAAAMCDATDIDMLTDLLGMALDDSRWRDRSRENGLIVSASFGWRKCAIETAAVYKRIEG